MSEKLRHRREGQWREMRVMQTCRMDRYSLFALQRSSCHVSCRLGHMPRHTRSASSEKHPCLSWMTKVTELIYSSVQHLYLEAEYATKMWSFLPHTHTHTEQHPVWLGKPAVTLSMLLSPHINLLTSLHLSVTMVKYISNLKPAHVSFCGTTEVDRVGIYICLTNTVCKVK